MPKLLSFILLLFPTTLQAQPNPQLGYPSRIETITEQLKTDSLNYNLIWERLEMQVNLLGNFPPNNQIYQYTVDSGRLEARQAYYADLRRDFNKLYENAILPKKYEIVEEGDFYLNRMFFHFNTHEIDKAIADGIYLRDSASYSKYSERGDYYNDWALFSLFNFYILKDNFEKALQAVDSSLEKHKIADPKIYYSTHGSFLNFRYKVELLDHYNKEEALIIFLKQICREHFEWYFEKAKYKDAKRDTWSLSENEYYTSKDSYLFYMNSAKDKSFQLLKLLTEYLDKYTHPDYAKYQAIYDKVYFKRNKYYETIDPDISDEDLRILVSRM
ncbi:MAG: hypothetical protein GYB31_16415 [Bacteroidetes bacterium]|nr:hypothetical protein [Bacteroidota bacterium]